MKLVMIVDVDLEESGWDPDAVRVILDSFARDLLVNGAENQEIGLTLRGVMEIE